MSQFDDAIEACKKQMEQCKIALDDDLLKAIAKGCGPSLYNKDASLVAAGDKGEIESIKKNFIAGKLGVEGSKADEAVQHAIDTLGSSNRHKHRPVFYYLIVTFLGKESVYA